MGLSSPKPRSKARPKLLASRRGAGGVLPQVSGLGLRESSRLPGVTQLLEGLPGRLPSVPKLLTEVAPDSGSPSQRKTPPTTTNPGG